MDLPAKGEQPAQTADQDRAGSTLEGWGRLPAPGYEVRGEDLEALTRGAVLSRGLGRSYGDSSLPPPGRRGVVGTTAADRILAFDQSTGVMRAEAGLSLHEILRLFFQRGFFPPVTPGTKFVTLGGMVASDVHGKNHHRDGTFGDHVTSLRMRVGGGRIVECSPNRHEDLFWATVGGMGLTGHILDVEFKMHKVPSPWILQESERIGDVDAFIERLKQASNDWPMTMGWIDCLSRGKNMGRGLLMRGRWATADEAPARFPTWKRRVTVPVVAPQFLLNPLTMRVFNELYYWKHWRRFHRAVIHPEPFFWPLDSVLHWNRMYGPKGFTQYQCVLPASGGTASVRRFLDVLTAEGASFLGVLKDFGPQGKGLLSFPCAGMTLALDIPVRPGVQGLIDRLNECVIAEGGRMYLTKDAFTRREHFEAMEPRLDDWQQVRRKWDPNLEFRSAQSVRMLGDPP